MNNKETEHGTTANDSELPIDAAASGDLSEPAAGVEQPASPRPAKRIAAAVTLGILLILTGFAAVWYLMTGSKSGDPVPVPRNTRIGTGPGSDASSGVQKLTLSDDQLNSAKLKIVEVGESLDGISVNETSTGVIEANEYGETPVISQVSGVVKTINAELGQFVRRGQTVAVVSSEELAQAQAKYLTLRTELVEAKKRYQRAVELGNISQETKTEIDQRLAELRTAEAEHTRHLSHYERTEKLVKIGAASRDEFESVTAMHKVAMAKLEEAKKRYERAGKLLKIDSPRKDEIDRFYAKVGTLEAEAASAREKLLVLGMSRGRVDNLRSPGQISADLPIPAPVSGTVTKRSANRGEVVSANAPMAEVTDLSTVWVIGQVYEKNLGKVRVGSGASITTETYPGELFRGRISYIDPALDEKTRTARVRVEIPNTGQKLKIGMYVNIAYASLGGSEKTTPSIPAEAVQMINGKQVVFQATDDPHTFIVRPVRLAGEKDGRYQVREGIFVGDKIVTEGSFLLRAELLKTNPAAL